MDAPSGRLTVNAETAWRHERKYQSKNPVQTAIMGRFHRRVYEWLTALRPELILDFGCGEGFFWEALQRLGPVPDFVGIDVRPDAVAIAQAKLPGRTILNEDLFEFDARGRRFDLVIASEVLEHLFEPDLYLDRLCALTTGKVLLTVPREPFFQLCNLARGRDLHRLGNHPEHVQRWSLESFRCFTSRHLELDCVESVFPFTIAVGNPLRG